MNHNHAYLLEWGGALFIKYMLKGSEKKKRLGTTKLMWFSANSY